MEMWIEPLTMVVDDFRSLVFFAKANGEFEQTKGHPGCWFEAHAIPTSSSVGDSASGRVEIYGLVESARRYSVIWCGAATLACH